MTLDGQLGVAKKVPGQEPAGDGECCALIPCTVPANPLQLGESPFGSVQLRLKLLAASLCESLMRLATVRRRPTPGFRPLRTTSAGREDADRSPGDSHTRAPPNGHLEHDVACKFSIENSHNCGRSSVPIVKRETEYPTCQWIDLRRVSDLSTTYFPSREGWRKTLRWEYRGWQQQNGTTRCDERVVPRSDLYSGGQSPRSSLAYPVVLMQQGSE